MKPDSLALRTLLVIASFLLVAGLGLPRLQLDAHYHAYFDANDPLVLLQKRLDERYGSLDQLMVLVSLDDSKSTPKPGDLAGLDSKNEGQRFFQLISQLDSALSALPFVSSVQSLADLDPSGSDEENLLSAMQELDGELSAARSVEQFRDHPFAANVLLSRSGRASLLEVRFNNIRSASAQELLSALDSVRSAIDPLILAAGGPYRYEFSGPLALNQAYIKTVRHDLKVFIPSMLLLFLLLLLACFRQLKIAIMLLAAPLLATLTAFGLAGLLGLKLAAINAFVPVMITSIGVAGAVHLGFAYCQALQQGETPKAARMRALSHNRLPLFLASSSTALGFLALSFSPSPPLRVVGYIVAMGVVLNYLLLMELLPGWLEKYVRFSHVDFQKRFRVAHLSGFITRHFRAVRWAGLLLGLGGLLIIPLLQVNDNVFEYFSPEHEFRMSANRVDQEFSGINVLQYELDSGMDGGVLDPQFHEFVERAVQWLQQLPETRAVHAYTQWLDWRAAAEKRSVDELRDRYAKLAHQTAATSPSSGPTGSSSSLSSSAGRYVSNDLAAARLLVFLPQMQSAGMLAFDRKVSDWMQAERQSFELRGGAGPSLTFAHLGTRNAHNLMLSLSLAMVVISLCCGWWMKSWRVALAALACNSLPIILVYGGWAVLGGEINLGSAVVLGMILGILVDDSIYLLCADQRARREQKPSSTTAMLRQVAPALMITSITLAAGLLLGLASEFRPIVAMAGLSAAVIVLALLADLLLLPAILYRPVKDGNFHET